MKFDSKTFYDNCFAGTACGRQLGMISGDIKDYQIDASSNHQDLKYSRALQSTRGWCTSLGDRKRWLMVGYKSNIQTLGGIQ